MNEAIEQEDMQTITLKHEHLSKDSLRDHSENISKKGRKYYLNKCFPQLILLHVFLSRKLPEPKLQLTLKPKGAVVDPNIELAQKVALKEEEGENLLLLPALSQSTVNTQESTRVPTINKNAGTTPCANSKELYQKGRVEMDHPNASVDTEATAFQTTALPFPK